MLLLDLPDEVLDNVYSFLSQKTLISLNHTCKYLHAVADFYLIQNIYFYDEEKQIKPYYDGLEITTKFTLIPLSKLSQFTYFLKQNINLIQSITLIIFGKCIDSRVVDLVSLLLKHDPKQLLCFRYEGQRLSFLSDDINDRNDTTRLYENDEINEKESLPITVLDRGIFNCFEKYPLYLSSLYVYNNDDTFKAIDLKLKLSTVGFYIDDLFTTAHLDSSLIEAWSKSVTTFAINNTASYRYLNQSLKFYAQLDNNSYIRHLFYRVQTLTLFITDEEIFDDLYTLQWLNMSSVKNLEIKFKRVRFSMIEQRNLETVDILNRGINFKKLKQLSIINLNYYNLFNNNNIYKDEIYGDYNLCYTWMNHSNIFGDSADSLTTLTLCLNTFMSDSVLFSAGKDYIAKKESILENLYHLVNLRTLIIPDFLFNWLPFLSKFGDINVKYNQSTNGKTNLSSYEIIQSLYRRFNNFDRSSSLNMTDYPPLRHCHDIETSNYFDSLVPVIKVIAENLTKLQLLNLGGFMIKIHRYESGAVANFSGVYDKWECLQVA